MITAAEFLKRWEGAPLVRATPEAVERLLITEEAKSFLRDAGLPSQTETEHNLRFDSLREGIPRLSDSLSNSLEGKSFERYQKIGASVSGHVCVDEKEGGHVVVVYAAINEVHFLNSSVPQLAESLLAVEGVVRRFLSSELDHNNFDDRKRACELLRGELGDIDPAAFNETKTIWGQFLDELEPIPVYFNQDDEGDE